MDRDRLTRGIATQSSRYTRGSFFTTLLLSAHLLQHLLQHEDDIDTFFFSSPPLQPFENQ